MITLGKTFLRPGTPRVALVVTDQDRPEDLVDQGIDLLEARVDMFQSVDPDDLAQAFQSLRQANTPLVLTVRNDPAEGGSDRHHISEDQKIILFKTLMPFADAVDIEQSSPVRDDLLTLARQHHKIVIVSSHYLQRSLSSRELIDLLNQGEPLADIVKIAVRPRSIDDLLTLIAFTGQQRRRHIITIGLGEYGRISRLVLPMVGSLLTYSYRRQASAEGQIPLKVLQEHLQFYCPTGES